MVREMAFELRKPRMEPPARTYWQEFWLFCHPKMYIPIFCFMVWGTVLAPNPDWFKFALEAIGVTAGVVLGAYRINALHDGGYSVIPDGDMIRTAAIGVAVFLIMASIATIVYGWYVMVLMLAGMFAIAVYNITHNKLIHNSITYAMGWGFFPVVLTYIYQTASLPTLSVIAFGVAAGIFGRMYSWNWGLVTCGVWAVCRRDDKARIGKKVEYQCGKELIVNGVVDDGRTCHSNSITCGARIQMPKEVAEHGKLRLNMDLAMVLAITLALVLL